MWLLPGISTLLRGAFTYTFSSTSLAHSASRYSLGCTAFGRAAGRARLDQSRERRADENGVKVRKRKFDTGPGRCTVPYRQEVTVSFQRRQPIILHIDTISRHFPSLTRLVDLALRERGEDLAEVCVLSSGGDCPVSRFVTASGTERLAREKATAV